MGVRGLQLDIQACITLLFPLCLGKCCDMGLSFTREVSDSPAAVGYINIMKSELIFKLNGRRIRKSSITTVLDCIILHSCISQDCCKMNSRDDRQTHRMTTKVLSSRPRINVARPTIAKISCSRVTKS